jgi:hypothetical protein
MRHSHGPLLQRASIILGGDEKLRAFLVANPSRFNLWMTGTVPLPWKDFLRVVDLLSEHYDEQIRQTRTEMRTRLTTQSRHQIERAKVLRARSLRAIESSRLTYARACELQRVSLTLRDSPQIGSRLEQHPSLRQPLFAENFAPRDRHELAEAALDAAMAVARADLGDLQLIELQSCPHVAAQRGFSAELVEALEKIERELPCDRQVQLHDLREVSTFNTPAGHSIIEAGSRSLVCTPVTDESGLVLGSINTHFHEPHDVEPATLALLTMVSRRTASWLDARLES